MLNGDQVANDALSYAGHPYLYGGSAGNSSGWDCSSFVNYVLGHDFGVTLPGGVQGYDGSNHGPTTLQYLVWTGAARISRKNVQAGDLCVWQTHMGIAINSQQMISAEDPANGTQVSNIDGAITGEVLTCMRVKGIQAGAMPLSANQAGNANPTINTSSMVAGSIGTWEKIGLILFAVAAILIGMHKLGSSDAA